MSLRDGFYQTALREDHTDRQSPISGAVRVTRLFIEGELIRDRTVADKGRGKALAYASTFPDLRWEADVASPRKSGIRNRMTIKRNTCAVVTVCLTLCAVSRNHSAAAGVIGMDTYGPGSFDLSIDFDLNPLEPGFFFEDDVDLLDQYTGVGVLFRDEPGTFDAPLGGSPGEIDHDPALSFPNSLKADHDAVFVLFETPVLSAGAHVMSPNNGDDSADDSADDSHDGTPDPPEAGMITLDAFDAALQLIGSISIEITGDDWQFIGFTSDVPVSAIGLRSESEEFNIDDLGAITVPEVSSLAVLLTGCLLLLSRRRTRFPA